jgi:hypothetical protein
MFKTMPPPPLKTALVVALDHSVSYNENAKLDRWYEDLCSFLRLTCRVYGAVINNTALMFLDDNQYKFDAVIVTDPLIMSRRNKYPALSDKLVSYVEDGGTLIISPYCRLGFGSSVQATDVDSYMERVWGLHWKLGTADTRDFKPNHEANIKDKERWLRVLTGRNMFAAQLEGAKAEEKLFIDPYGDGSPAISAPYGQGRLCWVGDVLLQKATAWIMIVLGDLHTKGPPQHCLPVTVPGPSATAPDPSATSPGPSARHCNPLATDSSFSATTNSSVTASNPSYSYLDLHLS